jgi:hypothetical protein
MAGVAAAAAVIAIALAAALLATPPRSHGRASPQDALRSVPRYYMALVPVSPNFDVANYAVVRDTLTGKTLATIRPPRPYITFIGVTGAADDRTFVLTAQSTLSGSLTSRDKFYYARFNPADKAVTLTPLALPGLPFSNYLNGAALSPDGTRLAVASQNGPAQITIYSLPSGGVRLWQSAAKVSALVFVSDVADVLSWSRTGILAFGWNGSPGLVVQHGHVKRNKNLESSAGEYLLNTNSTGGGLLADSRDAFCMPGFNVAYFGYLTPDGTKIIAPVPEHIEIGQRPPACTQAFPSAGAQPTRPELEEFSATTGRAIRDITTSRSPGAVRGSDVFWSNSSGSVLVVQAVSGRGLKTHGVFGVLSGGEFTPIPRASSPPLTFQLAF